MDSAAIRQRLLAQRAEIERLDEAANDAANSVELDQSRVGRLSRMDALQAQAMSRETLRRRQAALRKVDAALQRLDEGRYGECTECGEPIADGRLAADPVASLCVPCAEAAERH